MHPPYRLGLETTPRLDLTRLDLSLHLPGGKIAEVRRITDRLGQGDVSDLRSPLYKQEHERKRIQSPKDSLPLGGV